MRPQATQTDRTSWDEFIGRCAADVLAGRLTTQQLRTAVNNPRLRSLAADHDFRLSMLAVCQKLAPATARQRSLMLEIEAADRCWSRLLREFAGPASDEASDPMPIAK